MGSGSGRVTAGGPRRLPGVWFSSRETRDGDHTGMLPSGDVVALLPCQDQQLSCVRGSGVCGSNIPFY